jgi:hypothetical protein
LATLQTNHGLAGYVTQMEEAGNIRSFWEQKQFREQPLERRKLKMKEHSN